MSVQCYHHGPHCGGPLAERHGRDKRASKLYTSYFYKFDDNGSRRQEEHRFCFNHYMEYHHGLTAIRQADGNYIYAPVEALEYIPTGLMKND